MSCAWRSLLDLLHVYSHYFWNEVTGDTQYEDPGGQDSPASLLPFASPHSIIVATSLQELRCAIMFHFDRLFCSADVPLHDQEGNCFWLDDAGNRLDQDPNVSAVVATLTDVVVPTPGVSCAPCPACTPQDRLSLFLTSAAMANCCCSAACMGNLHIHNYQSCQANATLLQAGRYAWVETWSEEHNRPFYYDQVAQVSTWDKPADLAWRRVYIKPEAAEESPSNLEPK